MYDVESGTQDPTQKAASKGYSDGFLTAKIFAQYGMSRLGFIDQYIYDSMMALGPVITAGGGEHYYHDYFYRGLADGEATVQAVG
jgi:hypothetical protein